ncbi:MAG: hypothetical protein U1E53_19115 [Dongiaceae bacterium]
MSGATSLRFALQAERAAMNALRHTLLGAGLAALLAGLPGASPARAAALDADHIRREVVEALERIGGTGQDRVLLWRAVEVKPEGDALRIALDDLALRLDEENPVPLGTATFRLAGREDGTYQLDDLRLPDELRLGTPKDLTTIRIPKLELSGRWSPRLQTFLALQGGVHGLTAVGRDGLGSLGGLTVSISTAEKDGAIAGGDFAVAIDGLSVQGEDKTGLSLRTFAVGGRWSPELPYLLALDARVEALSAGDSSSHGSLDRLTYKLDMTDKGGGRWDETMAVVVDGAKIVDPGSFSFSLGELGMSGHVEGVDFAAAARIGVALDELGSRTPAAADLATLMSDIGRMFPSSGANEFRIADLAASDQTEGWTVALATARLRAEMAGFDGDAARSQGELAYGGLAVATGSHDMDQALSVLLPGRVAVSVKLEDVPARRLLGILVDQARSGAGSAGRQQSADPEALLTEAAPQLQAAVQQAGSKLRISPSELESPAARLTLDGHGEAAAASPLGGVAALTIEIAGLDRIIVAGKALLGPDEADGAKAFDLLRLASVRKKAADGTLVDRYVLVLSPEGEITVNDKPIDSLLQ